MSCHTQCKHEKGQPFGFSWTKISSDFMYHNPSKLLISSEGKLQFLDASQIEIRCYNDNIYINTSNHDFSILTLGSIPDVQLKSGINLLLCTEFDPLKTQILERVNDTLAVVNKMTLPSVLQSAHF